MLFKTLIYLVMTPLILLACVVLDDYIDKHSNNECEFLIDEMSYTERLNILEMIYTISQASDMVCEKFSYSLILDQSDWMLSVEWKFNHDEIWVFQKSFKNDYANL